MLDWCFASRKEGDQVEDAEEQVADQYPEGPFEEGKCTYEQCLNH